MTAPLSHHFRTTFAPFLRLVGTFFGANVDLVQTSHFGASQDTEDTEDKSCLVRDPSTGIGAEHRRALHCIDKKGVAC